MSKRIGRDSTYGERHRPRAFGPNNLKIFLICNICNLIVRPILSYLRLLYGISSAQFIACKLLSYSALLALHQERTAVR